MEAADSVDGMCVSGKQKRAIAAPMSKEEGRMQDATLSLPKSKRKPLKEFIRRPEAILPLIEENVKMRYPK